MISVLDTPNSSRGELRFRLLGVSVRIHPWFWFTTLIMGASRDTGSILVWVGVCFVSILVHEFGHVAAYRIFGARGSVVLYGFGGLAVPDREISGTFARFAVSVAGPMAGFALAALVFAVSIGASFHPVTDELISGRYVELMQHDLLWVNVFWGLINLLPIYPLDGGQAARALFERQNPARGLRRSLILSIVVGIAMAAIAFFMRSMYMVGLFGVLAATNAQTLESARPMFRPSESRR